MANPKKINLGVWAQGAIPFPFEHTFKDENGDVIDITAYTVSVKAEGPEDGNYGSGSVAKPDPTNGVGRYVFVADDFADVGNYSLLMWITNGSVNLHSDLVVWEVYDGPGTAGP